VKKHPKYNPKAVYSQGERGKRELLQRENFKNDKWGGGDGEGKGGGAVTWGGGKNSQTTFGAAPNSRRGGLKTKIKKNDPP